MQWDVKVDAPFFGRRIVGERLRQVPVDGAVAGFIAGDDLVQINIVGKPSQRLARLVGGPGFQRGAEMDFADLDAVMHQAGQGVLRFFKFHGEMAGVVIDAQMFSQARVVRMFVAHPLEEVDRLRAAFQQAHRFRLEAQVQFAPGLLADAGDVFDAAPEVVPDALQVFRVDREPFERSRQRADAALHAGGHQVREQVKEQVGVSQPLRRGPVRRIDLFLHAGAVEPAVGKSIDGENVTIILAQPALKVEQPGMAAQFHRRVVAQAQADRKRLVRTNPFPHGQHVRLERMKRLGPGLAAMDVRAVGEVEMVVQLHVRRVFMF